jgi:precorrin-2 dehydrogenase/sirohydrochlorin ferrochelatase
MPELFPAFLKLEGRRCLVVGAGPVAESKIESLVRCGADVCVVAPRATGAIRDAALAGEIRWEPRPFQDEDLEGIFLVVAATSFPALHEEIFKLAQNAGILCNAVDEPERCDFYYPSVVRRGPLQIAVSTSGKSPFLAQRLRQELEKHYGPEYGAWTEELGRARSALFARKISPDERRALLQELASEDSFRQFCGGRERT